MTVLLFLRLSGTLYGSNLHFWSGAISKASLFNRTPGSEANNLMNERTVPTL